MMSSGSGKAPTTKSGENNGRRQQSHRSHPTTKSNGTTKGDRSQPTTDINGSQATKTVGRLPEMMRFQDPRGHGSLLRFQEPCRSIVLAAGHHARIPKKQRTQHAHLTCAAPAALNIDVASKCSATLTVRHRTDRATASAAWLRETIISLKGAAHNNASFQMTTKKMCASPVIALILLRRSAIAVTLAAIAIAFILRWRSNRCRVDAIALL